MRGLLLALILGGSWLVAGCTTAWISAWQRDKERQEALAPARPTEAAATTVVAIRVRVYVDADFQRLFVDWEREVRRECEAANSWLEPFGARFEIASLLPWDHAHVEDLVAALGALRALDSGRDADWVLGLVGALPVYTDDMNTLGRAYVPGVHAVIRAIDDRLELDWMKRGLPMTSAGDVEHLYSARRRHKNAIQWIHEWAHGVGAVHVAGRPDSLMAAQYDPQMARFDQGNEELVRVACESRYGPNADLAAWARRAAALLRGLAMLEPDQRDVLAALETGFGASQPATSTKSTAEPGRKEAGTAGAALTVAANPWKGIEGEELRRLQHAMEVLGKRDPAAAWLDLVALRLRHGDHPTLQVMSCEVAAELERADAKDVCGVAKLFAPRDPRPALALVWLALKRNDKPEPALLAAMCDADELTSAPGDARVAMLADIAAAHGAISCAERAARFIEDPATRDKVAARVRQRRSLWGFSAADTGIGAREVALAQKIQAVDDDLRGGKTDVAVATARALVAEQPGSATWSLLGEASARQRRYPEARRLCVQALEAFDANARAHYVLAVLDLHEARTTDAQSHLRRVISEAPEHAPAWDLLIKVLKSEHRQSEVEALRKEYQTALGSAAPF
ncbi:MAG: hypothetical protein HY903_01915 [Deltaproteobacteria bacterium]|nr:hypothetical protein [Deltaproteobacteria bacterium]